MTYPVGNNQNGWHPRFISKRDLSGNELSQEMLRLKSKKLLYKIGVRLINFVKNFIVSFITNKEKFQHVRPNKKYLVHTMYSNKPIWSLDCVF